MLGHVVRRPLSGLRVLQVLLQGLSLLLKFRDLGLLTLHRLLLPADVLVVFCLELLQLLCSGLQLALRLVEICLQSRVLSLLFALYLV